MRIAIVHYHLNFGGVTRVIEMACEALAGADIPHVVLTGMTAEDCSLGVSPQTVAEVSRLGHSQFRAIEGLGYLPDIGNLTAEELTEQMIQVASEALGGPPDVWHFHNHSLGKNRLLPEVVARLAAANERLVLQIHDMAEQGRPTNYGLITDHSHLYPFSPRIQYAFVNSRDLQLFTASGLPPQNAILLPNPISTQVASLSDLHAAAVNSSPPLLFAPVRGIRRKNLGELIFLSALAPAGTRIAISREPTQPEALPIYETWKKFAAGHRLPIGFGVIGNYSPIPGAAADFETWVSHASHFISTSVAEGFGLPFLEAIARGKPLLGRNLPHLTADHGRHGIRAGNLYDQLLVPTGWVNLPILRDHLVTTMERNHRAYRRPLSSRMIDTTFDRLEQDGYLDFGNLPEPLQQGVIERLADPRLAEEPLVETGGTIGSAKSWLEKAVANRAPTASPAQLVAYSPRIYQESIVALYTQLLRGPISSIRHVPADEILTKSLTPHAFHFLLSALKPSAVPTKAFRAVIFDIYGTLLIAPHGGIKRDTRVDPVLREIISSFGFTPPESPSTALHAAVLRHHSAAGVPFPEVDLRILWRQMLELEPGTDTTALVQATEDAWHPASPMPGAENFIQRLSRSGISLGLLSNAQSNTLSALGGLSDLFSPELTILSYQHGIAKPAPDLFEILTDRLAGRDISPSETLFIGNDPVQDIAPASAAGFQTALFKGHPDSLRAGDCDPNFTFGKWQELFELF